MVGVFNDFPAKIKVTTGYMMVRGQWADLRGLSHVQRGITWQGRSETVRRKDITG